MLSIIVAISKNYCIGNGGKIPWKIPGEQKRFKELTTGNTVIMGRRTFAEIGRPLPNRKTVLVSNTYSWNDENCTTVGSFEEALRVSDPLHNEVYVAGGAGIYRAALPYADRLYITFVDKEVDGDTFFPHFDEYGFEVVESIKFEGEVPYTYVTYERIPACRRRDD
jgi:dihydrofolate reductase/dihydrofolate reductase (trimethoprim resistance protein)